MKKQEQTLLIDNIEAARALRETQFLAYFLEPSSPSEVAKLAGIAANLMHHHAKRYLELGLLFEAKREAGKVFYQLVARNFKLPQNLLPADEEIAQTLSELSSRFVKAYERSDRINTYDDADFEYASFGSPQDYVPGVNHQDAATEARPTHFQARSFRLSASSYTKLLREISDLIGNAIMDRSDDAAQCTLAFLAFEGSINDTPTSENSDLHNVNSFLPNVILGPKARLENSATVL